MQKYDHFDETMAPENEPPTPYWLMTVSCGRHISKAYIEWWRFIANRGWRSELKKRGVAATLDARPFA